MCVSFACSPGVHLELQVDILLRRVTKGFCSEQLAKAYRASWRGTLELKLFIHYLTASHSQLYPLLSISRKVCFYMYALWTQNKYGKIFHAHHSAGAIKVLESMFDIHDQACACTRHHHQHFIYRMVSDFILAEIQPFLEPLVLLFHMPRHHISSTSCRSTTSEEYRTIIPLLVLSCESLSRAPQSTISKTLQAGPTKVETCRTHNE